MATHRVEYDDQGLSKNDPWSLQEYLHEDGLSPRDQERVLESVLSWLREYTEAGVDLMDAVTELDPEGLTCGS